MSAAEGFGADRTPWGAVLRAALEALSRSLTKPSLDVQPSPRTFGPAVPDQGTIVLYVLSTLAQTCAALAAFVGVVGVYATHRMSVENRAEASGWRVLMRATPWCLSQIGRPRGDPVPHGLRRSVNVSDQLVQRLPVDEHVAVGKLHGARGVADRLAVPDQKDHRRSA